MTFYLWLLSHRLIHAGAEEPWSDYTEDFVFGGPQMTGPGNLQDRGVWDFVSEPRRLYIYTEILGLDLRR